MIKIVAIEREYGSGGGEIGSLLAKRLGWKVFDQELTAEIAKLAKVEASVVEQNDERVDPLLYRLTKVFWRGSYETVVPLDDRELFDADRMVHLVQQVMERISQQGNCVIVGRGAPWFLRGRPDTFSVFLYAPRAEKLRRLSTFVKDEAEAIEHLNTVDSERIAFVKRYFGKQWPTRTLYHVMLNTALGNDICLSTIQSLMGAVSELCDGRPAPTTD
jgi:cytidylate kinase